MKIKNLLIYGFFGIGFICGAITLIRWCVLTNIKLGLETQFYETAIEHMKNENKRTTTST